MVRLCGVSISALAAEKGSRGFSSVFPLLSDLSELYIDDQAGVYSLAGAVLQLVQVKIPDDSEDCLRVWALYMQVRGCLAL